MVSVFNISHPAKYRLYAWLHVYRLSCNAERERNANSYWLWQPLDALQEGWYTSVSPDQKQAIIIITTWSHTASSLYTLLRVVLSYKRGVLGTARLAIYQLVGVFLNI